MQTTTQGRLTAEHIQLFKNILGAAYVLADEETLHHYAHDETENLHYLPEVVIKPRTAEEISAVLKICNANKIPVTPRGAGTGLSGGALPQLGGVLLSTERMNSILNIDERNLQVTTEPGVITEVLMDAVKEKKLFYPPQQPRLLFYWWQYSREQRRPQGGKIWSGERLCTEPASDTTHRRNHLDGL
jgi:glycolate oxidase